MAGSTWALRSVVGTEKPSPSTDFDPLFDLYLFDEGSPRCDPCAERFPGLRVADREASVDLVLGEGLALNRNGVWARAWVDIGSIPVPRISHV